MLEVTGTTVTNPRPSCTAEAKAGSLLATTAGRRRLACAPMTGSRSTNRVSPRSIRLDTVALGHFPGGGFAGALPFKEGVLVGRAESAPRKRRTALCRTADREGRLCDRAYESRNSTSSSGRLTLTFIMGSCRSHHPGSKPPVGREVERGAKDPGRRQAIPPLKAARPGPETAMGGKVQGPARRASGWPGPFGAAAGSWPVSCSRERHHGCHRPGRPPQAAAR